MGKQDGVVPVAGLGPHMGQLLQKAAAIPAVAGRMDSGSVRVVHPAKVQGLALYCHRHHLPGKAAHPVPRQQRHIAGEGLALVPIFMVPGDVVAGIPPRHPPQETLHIAYVLPVVEDIPGHQQQLRLFPVDGLDQLPLLLPMLAGVEVGNQGDANRTGKSPCGQPIPADRKSVIQPRQHQGAQQRPSQKPGPELLFPRHHHFPFPAEQSSAALYFTTDSRKRPDFAGRGTPLTAFPEHSIIKSVSNDTDWSACHVPFP